MRESILEALKRVNEDVDFESSEDFVEDGLLDSFDIVTLVEELEDEFGVEISGTDIVPENFVNVDSIEALILKCREENE